LRSGPRGCTRTCPSLQPLYETTLNRSIIFRPLASAAVLALVAVAQPGVAALSQAAMRSQPAPMPANLTGILMTLHRAQFGAELAVSDGAFYRVRFASVAQVRPLRVGSRVTVSGDASSQVRLVVHVLRTQGASSRAHLRGLVGRRLGRGIVQVFGKNGAVMMLNLGRARITRVHRATGLFDATAASADAGPDVRQGDEIDTPVTLTGAGAVATGTATVAALPPVQVEVEGRITAVNTAEGTITVQDDDAGPATVVALGAARGTYSAGQDVEVYGTVASAGSSGATVQAQFIRIEQPEASEGMPAAPGTTIKVEGRITAVTAAAGTITVQHDDGPATVVALGAARGTYDVGQDVKVYGTVISAGSNGAMVQAQYISVDSPDGDGGDNDGD
jgi:hypothetical protein